MFMNRSPAFYHQLVHPLSTLASEPHAYLALGTPEAVSPVVRALLESLAVYEDVVCTPLAARRLWWVSLGRIAWPEPLACIRELGDDLGRVDFPTLLVTAPAGHQVILARSTCWLWSRQGAVADSTIPKIGSKAGWISPFAPTTRGTADVKRFAPSVLALVHRARVIRPAPHNIPCRRHCRRLFIPLRG